MDYVIVAITVLFGAGLTFFSGFGLGTIMLPVFCLFFDVSVAVGATAIVHLANNLFKFFLVSKHIDRSTLLLFGIPATIAGAIGAYVLTHIEHSEVVYSYILNGHEFSITVVKIVIGILMVFFALFDLSPRLSEIKINRRHLPYGGVLSGFFGGVSGHQGAFRATFLAKAGLTKEQFIGTSNAVSLGVDIARLLTYFGMAYFLVNDDSKFEAALTEGYDLLIVGIVFAFAGTYLGKKMVQKTTIKGIQITVGILLILMGLLMGIGLL